MTGGFTEKRRILMGYRKLRDRTMGRTPIGERLALLFDRGSFSELYADVSSRDPLSFPGYQDKLRENERRCRSREAVVTGTGLIDGIPAAAGELSRNFLMGSMSSAVGEKLTLLIEKADKEKLPLILFSASGGARMQEGMYSLFQMAKTAAAVERLKRNGGLYISVMTHPTTGGVSASFAMLGNVNLAEPGALIGFAGPRVIEQTIGEKLPMGFQSAEFQEQHGFVDRIVTKEETRDAVSQLLRLHGYRRVER
jgi:acetyl-CoA carboxylase carboxyl transferase beta subunit